MRTTGPGSLDRQRASRLRLVSDVARRTTAFRSLDELLPGAVRVVRETFDYFMVNIFTVEGDELVVSACTMPELQGLVGTLRLKIGQQGITGWVASTGLPLNVPDVRGDPRYSWADERELRTCSELAVPIAVQGRVLGVLDVQSEIPSAYSELDTDTLQTVADQLAVAIENARLYDALQDELASRRRREEILRGLHRAGLALQAAAAPGEVLQRAGSALGEMGLRMAAFLWDEGRRELQCEWPGGGEAAPPHPEALRRVSTGESAAAFDGGVMAALAFEGRSLGVLQVRGPGIGEPDLPAVLVFATEVAAAQRRTRLVQDLRESLEDLRRTQEQLLQAQKMEAVGRMAGGIAHDFSNQLTAIAGFADLVLDELPAGSQGRESAREILKAAHRATGLTRQLLAFSRRQVLRPRPCDLRALVDGLRPMLAQALDASVTLRIESAGEPVVARVDPSQLELAVVNLALNARDAMPDGGTLRIGVERDPVDRAACLLRVSDTGTGMPESVRRRIFEPFFTTKPAGKGTGLGLPTVYGIVTQSGGSIDCESEEGRGSVFTIRLPWTDEAPAPLPAPAPATVPVPSPVARSILVVEDEQSVRDLVVRILSSAGYRVAASGNAAEALEACQGAMPDLVLTDIVLPGPVSGIDLARRLRSDAGRPRILAMSGYHEGQTIAGMDTLPGVPFLPKPFTADALLAKVLEAMDMG